MKKKDEFIKTQTLAFAVGKQEAGARSFSSREALALSVCELTLDEKLQSAKLMKQQILKG